MKRLLLVFAFMLSASFGLLAQNRDKKVTDIVLKSVIGYDGQPITSGYVYGLDISKGLPLKVTDDGGYRSEVGMDFTLPGYESFYYKLLVSDKTQKSAYLLGSTADFRRLSLLFVQDKPPPLRFTKVREEKLRPFQEG